MITMHNVYDDDGIPIREHLKFLYALLSERSPEQSISHKTMPSFNEHARFVWEMPYREWLLIEATNVRGLVGAAYLTHNNEIGIFISKSAQRQGYGEAAVRYMLENYEPFVALPSGRPGHFVANVAPGNEPSRKLFERLGGKLIQVTYQL